MAVRILAGWRYPVKSMQGERLDLVRVGPAGVDGDHLFALRDPADGRVLTGRREPRLLMARARLVSPTEAAIELPDGSGTRTDDPTAATVLSRWMGRPVELVRAAEAGGAQFDLPVPEEVVEIYGADAAGDVVARLASGLKDSGPVHLLDEADLAGADVRRFRPNLLVSGSGPMPAGTLLALDEVRLRVTQPTVRCVMTTRPQPGLEAAPGLLRELAQRTRARLGVYAEVVVEGSIACG